MSTIATYIFFDLETTGLPKYEENKTRITELSLVALKRKQLVQSTTGQLPRVIHKLTMCFNPDREISSKAAEVSGLNNDLLANETMFNKDVVNIVNTFIKCQEKPVCLIAHNGHTFDFPILKHYFKKLNEHLPEDTMCADTMDCFYYLQKTPQNTETSADISTADENKVADGLKTEDKQSNSNSSKGDDAEVLDNEETPNKKSRINEMEIRPAKKIADVLNTWKEWKSLGNYYYSALGRRADGAHRAENDCLLMAEIAVTLAEQFKQWIDNNHCAFSEVIPMPIN